MTLMSGLLLLLAATPVAVAGMWEEHGAGVQSPGVVSASVSSASTSVEAEVRGKRLLVVNAQDDVVAVWSNTADSNAQVIVREGSMNGPAHEITAELMSKYERLLRELDWSQKGLVYGGLQVVD